MIDWTSYLLGHRKRSSMGDVSLDIFLYWLDSDKQASCAESRIKWTRETHVLLPTYASRVPLVR